MDHKFTPRSNARRNLNSYDLGGTWCGLRHRIGTGTAIDGITVTVTPAAIIVIVVVVVGGGTGVGIASGSVGGGAGITTTSWSVVGAAHSAAIPRALPRQFLALCI